MFIMPIPPTNRETEAMAASMISSVRLACCCAFKASSGWRILKSSGSSARNLCRWRIKREICSCAASMAAGEISGAIDIVEPFLSGELVHRGGYGHQNEVILVAAVGARSFRIEHTHHRARKLVHSNGLPRSVLSTEQNLGGGMSRGRKRSPVYPHRGAKTWNRTPMSIGECRGNPANRPRKLVFQFWFW